MQDASKEYKQSMRQYFRHRGFARITIGVINLLAQKSIQVNNQTGLLYISNTEEVFQGETPQKIYATPEEGFSKVDGSMFFAPPPNSNYQFYNNGLVSQGILGSIFLDFGGEHFDIKGITIDFSDYYPVDFTIETNLGVKSYHNNDKRYWSTEDVFQDVSFFKIHPARMINGRGRLRIFQFSCGITNVFTNNEIFNYSGKEYVSPITEMLPSNDVRFTVANYNSYYSPDNPGSAMVYMETGQEVRVAFGYDVDGKGNIEWLPEKLSYLKEWSANESEANFTSSGIFERMASSTYYKGQYRPEGISLYNLAIEVFEDAGIEHYFVDSYLKNIIVWNPLPVVSHPAALQLIANAGRCVLRELRDGRVAIQTGFISKMNISTNGQMFYSKVGNVAIEEKKDWYADTSYGFTAVDGSMYFPPASTNDVLNTGYISSSVWIEDGGTGHWNGVEPKIVIEMEAVNSIFGIEIIFKALSPKQFCIKTYCNNEIVDSISVDNSGLQYKSNYAFIDFDRMEIVFTKGSPNARIFVENVFFGENTDYILRRSNELLTSPVAIRQQKIKDISVSYTLYKESVESVVVASEEITVPSNNYEYLVYFNNPSYDLSVFVNSDNESDRINARIIESGTYYARIKFTGITSETIVRYNISGYEYEKEERKYVKKHNNSGEEKIWNNPLISTVEHAKQVEEWLASYFLGEVEYEIEWKGDPAVDANDLFELETKFGKFLVRDYENTLTCNGRWKGSMKARRVAR